MVWTTRLGALVLLGFSAFFFVKRSWIMGLIFFAAWLVIELLMFRKRRAPPPPGARDE